MNLNNEISNKQRILKDLEYEVNHLHAFRDEAASRKTQETTEHGQIIMTIDAIYKKLQKKVVEPLQISSASFKDDDEEKAREAIDFDHPEASEKLAKVQLAFILDKLVAL